MPDDLYERDILTWSEQQADLLRRVAQGERVNGVDWSHVIEEIGDVGVSELNAVLGHLHQAIIHLLKFHLWPDDPAELHWRIELDVFQANASSRFVPSMRQRIELDLVYAKSRARLARLVADNPRVKTIPGTCPWTLDELLNGDPDALLVTLAEATR